MNKQHWEKLFDTDWITIFFLQNLKVAKVLDIGFDGMYEKIQIINEEDLEEIVGKVFGSNTPRNFFSITIKYKYGEYKIKKVFHVFSDDIYKHFKPINKHILLPRLLPDALGLLKDPSYDLKED